MFYKIIIFFFSLSMVSCNCTKEQVATENEITEKKEGTAQEFKLPIQEVYYQKWIAGVKGGGSGIDLYLELQKPLEKGVALEKVKFESYEASFEKISETSYVAHMKTTLNELVLDENPKKEYGNQAPVSTLKPNEAILFVNANGKELFQHLENVKEKELLAYPSSKPQNTKE